MAANQESEEDYIKRAFLEKFKSFGRCGKLYRDKESKELAYKVQRFNSHPEHILAQCTSYRVVYNLCPVANGISHMLWFDIDSSKKKGIRAAIKIMSALRKFGYQPELAQSSRQGHFHISVWFERPQSILAIHGVCRQLLNNLKLQWVEFGPHWGKSLRPWHFHRNGLKKKGELWERGAIAEDLKPCIQLYYDYKNRSKKAFKEYPVFNIDDYLPSGPKGPKRRGDTNDKILDMVWNARVNSIGDDKILEYGKEMFLRGKVRGTLNSQMKHVKRALKYCYEPETRISFDDFWSTIKSNLPDDELIQALKEFTINNSKLKSFPLTVENYKQYRGIGIKQAWKHLRLLEQQNKLVVFKRGLPGLHGKATLYSTGSTVGAVGNNYISSAPAIKEPPVEPSPVIEPLKPSWVAPNKVYPNRMRQCEEEFRKILDADRELREKRIAGLVESEGRSNCEPLFNQIDPAARVP